MSLPNFGIHVLIDDRKEIVACYACDLHSLKSVLFCDLNAFFSSSYGVSASHIGDELDLVLPAERESLFHAVLEKSVVSFCRILKLGLLSDSDSSLS